MTKEQWAEVEQIVAECLDLEADLVDGHVRDRCAGRRAVETEVRSLLAAHARADGILDAPGGMLRRFEQAQAAFSMGTMLGPYRLVELIGRGGMGAVYRAERQDGQFHKQVAVKLILGACPPGEALRRFRDERQILADLEHPNLARLLDGGNTPEGVPYIVMEFVEGRPMSEYCRGLPRRERLLLFQQVCRAVQFAHRNLVVHRDIKPGNILVTADGVPKLLDFGVAKVLDRMPAQSIGEPMTAAAMTPDYASPEQVRMQPVTTASDMYSLGVLLYELMTGRRPYELSGKGLDQVVRSVCETDPPRPARVDRTIPRDLDAIVWKAMDKEPGRRYGSAEALAEDVDRYLKGLPVLARGSGSWYVMRKYAHRHKWSLAGLAAGALLLLAAAGVIVWQARLSGQRFEQVRKLSGSMIFEIHDAIERLPGSTPVRKLLVARGLEYLDALAGGARGDAALLNELASGYLRLGEVLGRRSSNNLGDVPGAVRAWEKAGRLSRRVLERDSGNLQALRTLNAVNISLAETDNARGAPEEALRRRLEAARIAERIVSLSPPSDLRALRSLASAYFGISGGYGSERNEESLEYMRKALEAFERILEAEPESRDALRNVSLCLKRLGSQMVATGSRQEGMPMLVRAREYDEKRVAANPNDAQARLDLAIAVSEIGVHLKHERRYAEALPYFERSQELRRSLYRADPGDARSRGRFVFSLIHLADVRREMGNPSSALSLYREAIAIESAGSADDPEHLIWAYTGAGRAGLDLGRNREACLAFRRALQLAAGHSRNKAPTKFTSGTAAFAKDKSARVCEPE